MTDFLHDHGTEPTPTDDGLSPFDSSGPLGADPGSALGDLGGHHDAPDPFRRGLGADPDEDTPV